MKYAIAFLLFVLAASGQTKENSWLLFHKDAVEVYKIQDNQCSLYLAVSHAGNVDGGVFIDLKPGPGCK